MQNNGFFFDRRLFHSGQKVNANRWPFLGCQGLFKKGKFKWAYDNCFANLLFK